MTREEAIKIVQSAMVWTDEERDALAMLIPELAESEDERIRKWLIAELKDDYFTDYTPDESKAKAEKAIAYLEKQKEPHYTKRNALFDKCVENCDPEVMKRVSDEVDEMLEKEHNPSFTD